MELSERGPQQRIDFEASEPQEQNGQKLSDSEYFSRLIEQEGSGTYFCPRCGGLQHTGYMCMDCGQNYPNEVIPLNADSFSHYARLIRDANPL